MRSMLAVIILALMPGAAFGASYSVPNDFATIQAAIDLAPDGSTILVAPGTYAGEIFVRKINKDLYFQAPGGPGQTFIDGGGTTYLIKIDSTGGDPLKNVVFDGFTFRNGWSDQLSPVVIWKAQPSFLNCVFSDNASNLRAGAVVVNGLAAAPSFVNCTFRNNRSASIAGAVLVNGEHCQAYFKGCLFENNTSATASGTSFNEGGALYFGVAGGVVLDSVFRGNATDYAGGAIMVLSHFGEGPDTVTVKGSRFEGNTCVRHSAARPHPSEGGAIMAEGDVTVNVAGCLFTGNRAESGAALQSYRANLAVSDSVFDGNTADGTEYLNVGGGAIGVNINDGADLDRREPEVRIERTLIRNSSAPVGGGIFYQGDARYGKAGTFTLADVTIDSCRAASVGPGSGYGGAIYLALATGVGDRVNLLRNAADQYGGAVMLLAGSALALRDSFVAANTAIAGGWYYANGVPPPALTRTVVAYNDGDATAAAELLAAVPPVTIDGQAYLTYFASPAPAGIEVAPLVGPVPRVAAAGTTYAAGSAVAPGVLATTRFTLTSAANPTATVTSTGDGLTDAWYHAAPLALPGRIEAEDFDRGGERLGYRDRTAANDGGAYRPSEGVDIGADAGASGGHVVGWLAAGEWLDYSTYAAEDVLLDLWAGVSSSGGGTLRVLVDGEEVSGPFAVPGTGGAVARLALPAVRGAVAFGKGHHVVRVVVVEGGFNLDYLEGTVGGTRALLALDAAPATVVPGGAVALAGSLTGWPLGAPARALTGKDVTIEARAGTGLWTPLGTAVTGADGSFAFAHAPVASTVYRASWPGGTDNTVVFPAASGEDAVGVAPALTLEALGFRKVRAGYLVYPLGTRVRLLGALAPGPYPGEVRVTVERYASARWQVQKVSARLLDPAGAYKWRWRPTTRGKYRIQSRFAGSADLASTQSSYRFVRAR